METMTRNLEGRCFTRIPFRRSVRFSTLRDEKPVRHVAQDLSQGGLRFLSSEFLPVNSSVRVEIQLKDQSRVVELDGRVVWVRYNPMAETYQMGLQFSDDSAFQRMVIGEFIRAK